MELNNFGAGINVKANVQYVTVVVKIRKDTVDKLKLMIDAYKYDLPKVLKELLELVDTQLEGKD